MGYVGILGMLGMRDVSRMKEAGRDMGGNCPGKYTWKVYMETRSEVDTFRIKGMNLFSDLVRSLARSLAARRGGRGGPLEKPFLNKIPRSACPTDELFQMINCI